jgi:ferredoxin
MPKLTLKPTNQVLEVSAKKSIFEQLNNMNIHLNSSCAGFGTCGDCVVKITKGEDQCSPPTYEEIKLLGNVFHLTHERLSCQLKIQSDVEIDISAQLNSSTIKRPAAQKSLKTKRRNQSANQVGVKSSDSIKVSADSSQEVKSTQKEAGFNRPKRKL